MYTDNRAEEIYNLFTHVRNHYFEMLKVISNASKIDHQLSKEIFLLSATDSMLLKQDDISEKILAEVTDKNNFLFTLYMPDRNTINTVLLDKPSDFSEFTNEKLGKLSSLYDELQMRVVIAAKKIIDISPEVGQQLFDLDEDCTEALSKITIEDLFNLSARYAWLVVLNNKRSVSVFNDTASLRNKAERSIVDSALNY